MPPLLDCLSDCQSKVRSDLMSFLKLDSDEFIAIVECTIDEAKELIDMEYIKDINTIYLIENLEKFI